MLGWASGRRVPSPLKRGSLTTSGKTLGGSTSINGATWTRAGKEAFDALPLFLRTNSTRWAWDSMLGFMEKSETFAPPEQWQINAGVVFNESLHGQSGPVQVTYGSTMYRGDHQRFFEQVITGAGVPNVGDPAGGDATSVAWHASSLQHQRNDERSSSATAYWNPIEGQANIAVLVGHQVTKIHIDASTNGTLRATGVSYTTTGGGGETYNVRVGHEVILAAGAIMSPHILQVSGIGPASDLASAGIAVVLDLPGVGRNLQEQTLSTIAWPKNADYDPQGLGPSNMIAYPAITALVANASAFMQELEGKLGGYAGAAVESGAAVNAEGAEAAFRIQVDLLEKKVGAVELFLDGGWPDGGLGINMWTLLPFSRGRVRSISPDALSYPRIETNFFSADTDMALQIAGCKLARKAFSTEPLRSVVQNETMPGPAVPDNGQGGADEDEDWKRWIEANFGTVSHPIGTCAMMKREWGGVVDETLTVYGTANLRVVDASVLPIQLGAHLSANLYGVAENAADLIKSAWGIRGQSTEMANTTSIAAVGHCSSSAGRRRKRRFS